MKKLSIASLLMLASLIVAAQKKDPAIKETTVVNQRNSSLFNSHLVTFSQMDQRKIYHWGNGQRSTPTGRQAGEVTPEYVWVLGDSAHVVWNPFMKSGETQNGTIVTNHR